MAWEWRFNCEYIDKPLFVNHNLSPYSMLYSLAMYIAKSSYGHFIIIIDNVDGVPDDVVAGAAEVLVSWGFTVITQSK